MAQDNDELAHWELRIADLERRVADQKRRVAHEGDEALGSREVLHLMEQAQESWRTHRRSLLRRVWNRQQFNVTRCQGQALIR